MRGSAGTGGIPCARIQPARRAVGVSQPVGDHQAWPATQGRAELQDLGHLIADRGALEQPDRPSQNAGQVEVLEADRVALAQHGHEEGPPLANSRVVQIIR